MPHLVRQSGAGVAGCCMLVALDALNGRQPLEGIPSPVFLHVCGLSHQLLVWGRDTRQPCPNGKRSVYDLFILSIEIV